MMLPIPPVRLPMARRLWPASSSAQAEDPRLGRAGRRAPVMEDRKLSDIYGTNTILEGSRVAVRQHSDIDGTNLIPESARIAFRQRQGVGSRPSPRMTRAEEALSP